MRRTTCPRSTNQMQITLVTKMEVFSVKYLTTHIDRHRLDRHGALTPRILRAPDDHVHPWKRSDFCPRLNPLFRIRGLRRSKPCSVGFPFLPRQPVKFRVLVATNLVCCLQGSWFSVRSRSVEASGSNLPLKFDHFE